MRLLTTILFAVCFVTLQAKTITVGKGKQVATVKQAIQLAINGDVRGVQEIANTDFRRDCLRPLLKRGVSVGAVDFGIIAMGVFLLLGFVTWSYRDVANRHEHKTSSSNSHH